MDVSSRTRFSLRRAGRPAIVVMRRRRAKKPSQPDRGETVVRTLSIGLAVASTAFAGYMIAHVERQPQFAGLEHLSIFSRPTTAAALRAQERAASGQKNAVDFTPVGSIGESERDLTSAGFVLLGVRGETAVIQTPSTIIRVSAGDVVDGLGRIVAIERRGGKWAVITPSGVIVGN
jgi:hypothetical protein